MATLSQSEFEGEEPGGSIPINVKAFADDNVTNNMNYMY